MSDTHDEDGAFVEDFLEWCRTLESREADPDKEYPPLPDEARQMMEDIIREFDEKGL